MKKLLALILAAALALSLVACGGGSGAGDTNTPSGGNDNTTTGTTTQLDAENAIAETPRHIEKDVGENQARAMQNTYLIDCHIGTIADTYFTSDYGLQIYLPSEQLAQLNKGDNIAIIGQITDVKEETDANGFKTKYIIFGIAEIYDGIVPDVAPRDDEKYIGVLNGEYDSTKCAWNVVIVGNSSTRPVYFADGEDVSTLKNDDAIIFSADAMGFIDNPEYYTNAKIIEVMSLEEMDKYLAGIS